jgi:hypothetical protein
MRKKIGLAASGALIVLLVVLAVQRSTTGRPGGTQAAVTTAPAAERVAPGPVLISSTAPLAPAPRLAAAPVASKLANVAEPIESRFLGEDVAKPEDCRAVCGAPCYHDPSGKLRCGKECKGDNDCDAESICHATRTGIQRCAWSECSGIGQDAECGPGMTCLAIARPSGAVYVCSAAGLRKAGEACLGLGDRRSPPSALCGPGMLCREGVCLPSQCSTDTDCPKGAKCQDAPGGLVPKPQCVPSCTQDGDCPEGLECVEYPPGRKVCADTDNAECLREGCASGLNCEVTLPLLSRMEAACVRRCTPADQSGCPAGESCEALPFHSTPRYACTRTCSETGEPCPDGQRCAKNAQGHFTCKTVFHANDYAGSDEE